MDKTQILAATLAYRHYMNAREAGFTPVEYILLVKNIAMAAPIIAARFTPNLSSDKDFLEVIKAGSVDAVALVKVVDEMLRIPPEPEAGASDKEKMN